MVVLARWASSFVIHSQGSRLITGEPHLPPIKNERPERMGPDFGRS